MSRRVAAVGLGLWLLVMGFLLGRLAEKVWFNQARAAVLDQLSEHERRVLGRLMRLEHRPAFGCGDARS